MYKFLLIIVISSLTLNLSAQKKILAIFAHPDDETVVSPVLAEYASKGYDITVVISTDGRYGFTDHFGMKSADSLMAVRKEEIMCSCDAIGINTPILLRAHDGLKGIESVDAQFTQFEYIEKALTRIIQEIKPHILITMGPEGDSGHPDHRIVSAIVTQIYHSFRNDMSLYYHSWSEVQAFKYKGWNLHSVDSSRINTIVSYSEASEAKHFNAIRCYKSQYSSEAMEDWISRDENDKVNEIYFRKVVLSSEKYEGF